MVSERSRAEVSIDNRIRNYLLLKGISAKADLTDVLNSNIKEVLEIVVNRQSSKTSDLELSFFIRERFAEIEDGLLENQSKVVLETVVNLFVAAAEKISSVSDEKADNRIKHLFDLYVQSAVEIIKQLNYSSESNRFNAMTNVLSSIGNLWHHSSFRSIHEARDLSPVLTEYISSMSYNLQMVYDNTVKKRKKYFLKYLELGELGIVDQETLFPIVLRYLGPGNNSVEKNILVPEDLSPTKFPKFFKSIDPKFRPYSSGIRPLIYLREKQLAENFESSSSTKFKFYLDQLNLFFDTDGAGNGVYNILQELELYVSELQTKIEKTGSAEQLVELNERVLGQLVKWQYLGQYEHSVVSFLKSMLRSSRAFLEARETTDEKYEAGRKLVEVFARYFAEFPDSREFNNLFQNFLEVELSPKLVEEFFQLSMEKIDPLTKTIQFESPVYGKIERLVKMCNNFGSARAVTIRGFSLALSKYPSVKAWITRIPKNHFEVWTMLTHAEMYSGFSQLEEKTPESVIKVLIEKSVNWPGSKSALAQLWFFDYVQHMSLDLGARTNVLKLVLESDKLDSTAKVSFAKLVINQFNSNQANEFLSFPEARILYSKHPELRKAWESQGKSTEKKPGFCERALLRFK